MNEDQSVLYTDGKNVVVTSSELVVDSVRYLLKSIHNVRLHFIQHFKYPPLTFIIAGVILMIGGLSGLLNDIQLDEIYIGNFLITAQRLFIIVGSILVLLGLLWLSILQNKYVLVISTDDSEWNSIPIATGTGKRKDELSKIATVLSNAIDSFKKK